MAVALPAPAENDKNVENTKSNVESDVEDASDLEGAESFYGGGYNNYGYGYNNYGYNNYGGGKSIF